MTPTNDQATTGIDALPDARQAVLRAIKQMGHASAGELAESLGQTREACRQQLLQLQRLGLVCAHKKSSGGAGRPTQLFSLSDEGEHLFPKRYDELSLLLLDTVSDELGEVQLKRLMGAITDRQVAAWQAQLAGLPLRKKLEALKDFYFKDDAYTQVIEDASGLWLVEQNCPFLNLAMERPALCSITVSTLSRLLGFEVRREKRFQQGDGHCAFRVLTDRPIEQNFRFAFED